jgi:hypothetical protein
MSSEIKFRGSLRVQALGKSQKRLWKSPEQKQKLKEKQVELRERWSCLGLAAHLGFHYQTVVFVT